MPEHDPSSLQTNGRSPLPPTKTVSSPIFASSVTYMLPLVACFWGILDGESLTLVQGLGAFIVLAGVYLSARK